MTPKTATTPETIGPHVTLIQNALVDLGFHTRLSQASRAALNDELNAGRYGPNTASCVQAFKSQPPKPILAPGQRIADNILDIATLDALDNRMQIQEARDKPIKPISVDILIFLSGVQNPGGLVLPEDTPDTPGYLMRLPMKAIAARRPNAEFRQIGGSLVEAEMNAGWLLFRDFINAETTNPPGRVVVYGYSAGANNALEYCRRLEAENMVRKLQNAPLFKIDLLITVDAAVRRDRPNFGIDRTVAGCVVSNVNFYQTYPTPKWSSLARGDANTALPSIVTGKVPAVENRNLDKQVVFTTAESPHAQAERMTVSHCEKLIEACLKPVFFDLANRR